MMKTITFTISDEEREILLAEVLPLLGTGDEMKYAALSALVVALQPGREPADAREAQRLDLVPVRMACRNAGVSQD